ncbi:hypothetical protein W97_02776 [Coniosporium apollinis CBS 100218]|uniref:GST N-terminal domain-containing protein n=1 Tax=Coniosporium apollinis (strain CBS 100218) TaxID=1168221 RepID=R7YNW1_CONA1|nr:uncharacterized protein W97_02776 [Coniosporium apollinis CBS 100218]EON63548.1 hypothetical protein W97_02776 [Coniosporium apollinis CBS 100218]
MPSHPWLLYVYPWMPYPRRVIIYLREKDIPSSLVTVVPVSDPQRGSKAPPEYPPKPPGSLPILAIPNEGGFIYIRQSLAIINYLDELCDAGASGFPLSTYPMRGANSLARARHNELLALADECTIAWNPVRMFGSGAGTMSLPAASKEMARWVYRSLATIESWWQEEDRDMARLRQGGGGDVTVAEIVLYQFLEFVGDCYGRDMTREGEVGKDVYGREGTGGFSKIGEFLEAFGTRESARRDSEAGEIASEEVLSKMRTWAEGSL